MFEGSAALMQVAVLLYDQQEAVQCLLVVVVGSKFQEGEGFFDYVLNSFRGLWENY